MEKGGFCTLAQITEHFDIARSNALSYLYNLHKDHGLGYAVDGDNVVLWLSPGCASPFSDGHVVTYNDFDFLEDPASDKCEFKTLSAKEEEGLDFDDDFLEENEDDFLEEKPTKNDDDLWLE